MKDDVTDDDWLCELPDTFLDEEWGDDDDFQEFHDYWPSLEDEPMGRDIFPHLPVSGGVL